MLLTRLTELVSVMPRVSVDANVLAGCIECGRGVLVVGNRDVNQIGAGAFRIDSTRAHVGYGNGVADDQAVGHADGARARIDAAALPRFIAIFADQVVGEDGAALDDIQTGAVGYAGGYGKLHLSGKCNGLRYAFDNLDDNVLGEGNRHGRILHTDGIVANRVRVEGGNGRVIEGDTAAVVNGLIVFDRAIGDGRFVSLQVGGAAPTVTAVVSCEGCTQQLDHECIGVQTAAAAVGPIVGDGRLTNLDTTAGYMQPATRSFHSLVVGDLRAGAWP